MNPHRSIANSLAVMLTLGLAQPILCQTPMNFGLHTGLDTRSVGTSMQGESVPPTGVGFQQQAGRKDPFVAGLLSLLIPGVGSYYAGHNGHGTRHLLIFGVGLATYSVGTIMWTEDCLFDFDRDCQGGAAGSLIVVGSVVVLVNSIWGIVTAVGDANAHNQVGVTGTASVRLFGGVYVEPTIHVFSPPGPRSGADSRAGPRVGLQLLRWGF